MVVPVLFDMEGLEELWQSLAPWLNITAGQGLGHRTQIPPFPSNDSKVTQQNTKFQLAQLNYNAVVFSAVINK